MARNVVGSQQRVITQEVASNTGSIIKAGFSLGQEAVLETHKANQEAKLFSNMSEARIKINDLTNDYKVNYEGDPDKGLKEYQNKVNSIFEEYGKDFKGVYANSWGNDVKHFSLSNNISMKNWGLQQKQRNTLKNIETAMSNSYLTARQNGQKYGVGESNINSEDDFISDIDKIKKIGEGVLGSETIKKALEGYKSKYSTSFIYGVADSNPYKAEELLKEDLTKYISEADIKKIKSVISKGKELIQDSNLANAKTKSSELFFSNTFAFDEQAKDMVNNKSYYKKKLGLDEENYEKILSYNKGLKSDYDNLKYKRNPATMKPYTNEEIAEITSIAQTSKDYVKSLKIEINDDGEYEIKGDVPDDIYSVLDAKEGLDLARRSKSSSYPKLDEDTVKVNRILNNKIKEYGTNESSNWFFKSNPETLELVGNYTNHDFKNNDTGRVSVFERVYGEMKKNAIPVNSTSQEDKNKVKEIYQNVRKEYLEEQYPGSLGKDAQNILNDGEIIQYKTDGSVNGIDIDDFGGYNNININGIKYNVLLDEDGNIIDKREAL